MNNEKWEEEYESLLRLFLVQQLAWEKSKNEGSFLNSPVLQEIAETKYKKLKSFMYKLLQDQLTEVEKFIAEQRRSIERTAEGAGKEKVLRALEKTFELKAMKDELLGHE